MYVNSQGALNSWTSSRARQLTKDLGAYSPHETHMKEPTSTHVLSSYALLVGTPICPSVGKQVQNMPQATSRRKMSHQGTNTLSKAKMPREAKSKHLVKFPFAGFCPSKPLFSLLCLMGCLRVKGEPRASRLGSSYFSRPHAPPGLAEP